MMWKHKYWAIGGGVVRRGWGVETPTCWALTSSFCDGKDAPPSSPSPNCFRLQALVFKVNGLMSKGLETLYPYR